ncbi:hypothetical protein [Thermoactinospora rubra]|uniref:hypothetical protein n=1 Tax=Thermoactinospora rubra TaxID=1088767 RepID=UPI00198200BA|nr:hypothetical protein [Thermoactinospora rubra]
MRRIVAVLARAGMAKAAPGEVDPDEFLRAMAEDVYEVAAGLELVTPVLVTSVPELEEIVWPGTQVIAVAEDVALRDVFAALDGDQAAVVAADAPDLPPLLIGKLFRELGRAPLAVCPSENGGAAAMAATLPLPGWAHPGLDEPDPLQALRAQAPGRRMVAAGPGWHRLRSPEDVRFLDPGLEGWDNTRALLRQP